MLRKNQGRIVNVSSIMARIASPYSVCCLSFSSEKQNNTILFQGGLLHYETRDRRLHGRSPNGDEAIQCYSMHN